MPGLGRGLYVRIYLRSHSPHGQAYETYRWYLDHPEKNQPDLSVQRRRNCLKVFVRTYWVLEGTEPQALEK